MKKYFGILSVFILIITLFSLRNDWRVGVAGIVIGLILAIKAPKGVSKYIAYTILVLCVLFFVFLIIMGILMAGLVEID
ncbi:hypothetical protein SFC65_18985 [Priestia filamentosa]|uniref:hypothetical protein n=1 Tax=Priestia filamentosa TaxID=1402861 RepID=UPI0039824461